MNSVTRLAAKIMEELGPLQGQTKHEGKIGRGFAEEMGK